MADIEYAMGSGSEDGRDGKTFKRRGLIAGAAVLAAGILAKRAAEPAAAAGSGDGSIVTVGQTTSGSHPTVIQGLEIASFTPFVGSTVLDVTAALLPITQTSNGLPYNVDGIHGTAKGTGTGVVGNGSGNTDSDGVRGFGTGTSSGVAGFGGSISGSGLFGQGSGPNGPGVRGYASGGGPGVLGTGISGHGVSGVTGGSGLVAGLYGTSASAYGIIGNTTASGYSGLTGTTNTAGVAALAATALVNTAFAAYFTGLTYVQGNFTVTGNKNAAVMHPDGTRRLFYCTEAPEAWFEDFGEGKLVGGKADVKLDPEFVQFILADAYHVFITPRGDYQAHVTQQSPTGFSVQQTTGTGSAGASGLFSWRVVGKRKDSTGKRLEKFTPIKLHALDPDKLPKLPSAPATSKP